MGWGSVPSEQRAAEQAAEVAAVRAQARAQLSPFETESVELFKAIRDTLTDVRDALKSLLDQPDCAPMQYDAAVASCCPGHDVAAELHRAERAALRAECIELERENAALRAAMSSQDI